MPAPETAAAGDRPDRQTAADRSADRRRRRAAAFGDALPDQTRGERDSDGPPTDRRDEDLRREVPPHHG
jgi:hypothetical protein